MGECPAQVRAAVVGDAAPGAGVEGAGEEEPAFGGFEIGEVALPDQAGPIRRGDFRQPVLRDGVIVSAVSGARPEAALLPGPQAAFPHPPGEAILAAALTVVLEIEPHPQTTVGAPTLREALRDERAQLFVVLATRAQSLAAMRGKAALADLQRLGQRVGGILGRELFHQREACGGISADKMPKAFFKMSRWRVTYSSSCRKRRRSRCSAVSTLKVFGSLSACPVLACSTQRPSDHLETPRSRATSVTGRPLRTSATALFLNSRSWRRPVLPLLFMAVIVFITVQPAKSRKL